MEMSDERHMARWHLVHGWSPILEDSLTHLNGYVSYGYKKVLSYTYGNGMNVISTFSRAADVLSEFFRLDDDLAQSLLNSKAYHVKKIKQKINSETYEKNCNKKQKGHNNGQKDKRDLAIF